MRFRLLHRRLTISSPRMAISSAMPWPFRWALAAIVMGFCGAIALWAFELGKDIAGLEEGSIQELNRLRSEVTILRADLTRIQQERDKAQSVANTVETVVQAEKAAQQSLLDQIKQLELNNRELQDDLGFFEKLIPANGSSGISIRGLQADMQGPYKLRWQVLVIQSNKNASVFNGRLEMTFTGLEGARPWSSNLPNGPMNVKIGQYGRLEGILDVPPQVVVKSVSVRLMEGTNLRATHSVKL
jgi:hypothetical protein